MPSQCQGKLPHARWESSEFRKHDSVRETHGWDSDRQCDGGKTEDKMTRKQHIYMVKIITTQSQMEGGEWGLAAVRVTLQQSHSRLEVHSDGWAEGDIDLQVH